MFTHRAFVLALVGGLFAAPAAFASSAHMFDETDGYANSCRAMAELFDKAVVSAPASAATDEAKALRASGGEDCFDMSATVDNQSIGFAKIAAALEKIGIRLQEPTPPPSELTPGG